jgi:hypothetical protein
MCAPSARLTKNTKLSIATSTTNTITYTIRRKEIGMVAKRVCRLTMSNQEKQRAVTAVVLVVTKEKRDKSELTKERPNS